MGGTGRRGNSCAVPLMLEAFTRVTRGETGVLFMSAGEGGREPGGICFARPLRRELSKTFQKLGGDSLGRQLKQALKHPWLLQTPGSVRCPPRNPWLSKSPCLSSSQPQGIKIRGKGCAGVSTAVPEGSCGAGKLEPRPCDECKGG